MNSKCRFREAEPADQRAIVVGGDWTYSVSAGRLLLSSRYFGTAETLSSLEQPSSVDFNNIKFFVLSVNKIN